MCCNDNFKERAAGEKIASVLDLSDIKGMKFFDPHIHMTSRTTDDYQAMADAGIVALIEPAFWLGQPRTGVATFRIITAVCWAGKDSGLRNSALNIIVLLG